MTYPPGAGPEAAAFSGTVYQPPAEQTYSFAGDGTTTTSATRPSVAHATGQADDAGRIVATFTPPPTETWSVRRIVVQSTVRGQALVYVGTVDAANLVSGTISGNLDENDPNQPYLVPEGTSMRVHWIDGGTCSARIEYTVI